MKAGVKNIILVILVAVSASLLTYIFIQSKKDLPPLPPKPRESDAVNISGTVENYLGDKNGDIDKMRLNDGKQILLLHFPPHTAKQVMLLAPKNSLIKASVFDGLPKKPNDDFNMYNVESITTSASSLNINDIAPPPPVEGKEVELTGTITSYKRDDHGMINGFVINNYIVQLPPHAVQNIVPLLQNAKQISVKGFVRDTTNGFVNISGLMLVKPSSINIDKTNYLL